jgi:hypothetical protein
MQTTARDALLTKIVHDIARFNGRDPSGLHVSSTDDGGLCVQGAFASAFYALEDWARAFHRDLDDGFFDRPGREALIEPRSGCPEHTALTSSRQ